MDKDNQNCKTFPPADFSTFMLSLAFTARMHLGLVESPETKKVSSDMAAARHAIDMIDMLKEKTKGNLTPEEQNLLDELLFDLRMTYMEKSKQ